MAQLIGGLVLAAAAYFLTMVFGILGFGILGLVVWLSTESFLGGVLVTGGAVAAFLLGYVTLPIIAIVVAIWTFVAWGLK